MSETQRGGGGGVYPPVSSTDENSWFGWVENEQNEEEDPSPKFGGSSFRDILSGVVDLEGIGEEDDRLDDYEDSNDTTSSRCKFEFDDSNNNIPWWWSLRHPLNGELAESFLRSPVQHNSYSYLTRFPISITLSLSSSIWKGSVVAVSSVARERRLRRIEIKRRASKISGDAPIPRPPPCPPPPRKTTRRDDNRFDPIEESRGRLCNECMRSIIIEGFHASITAFNATHPVSPSALPIRPQSKANTENPIVTALRLCMGNAWDVLRWWYDMCGWLEQEGFRTVMCGFDDEDDEDDDDIDNDADDDDNNNNSNIDNANENLDKDNKNSNEILNKASFSKTATAQGE